MVILYFNNVQISRGGEEKAFKDKLSNVFKATAYEKPDASRSDSAEIYCFGRGFMPSRAKKHASDQHAKD